MEKNEGISFGNIKKKSENLHKKFWSWADLKKSSEKLRAEATLVWPLVEASL